MLQNGSYISTLNYTMKECYAHVYDVSRIHFYNKRLVFGEKMKQKLLSLRHFSFSLAIWLSKFKPTL